MTDLDAARAALLAERELVLARLAGLRRDLGSSIDAAAAANADDEHDPEGATIAYERQLVAAHIEHAEDQLRQIDAAVARLDADSYGVCEGCGQAIPAARLAARPTATTCISCAQRR